MAGNIPVGSMSTSIKLNGSESVHTLRELKQAVQQATSAWKAQRAELSSLGKSTDAAETKYKGLAEAIKKQKDYISGLQIEQKHLEEAQKGVDRTTKDGQQTWGKYNEALQKNATRIHSAETRLTSLTSQQTKAKRSLDYYKSGLADAQKQLRLNDSVTKSYVARLSSEGKGYEAAKAKLSGYRSSIENLTKQQKIQENELSKIASESGKSSEAYARQRIRVNETATSIAKLNKQVKSTQSDVNRLKPTGFNRIANGAKHVTNVADKMKAGLSKGWNAIKSGATTAAAGIGVVGAAAISGAKKSASLQQSYKEITNLAVTGGEKQREAIKNVTAMQRQGRNMSIKYGKSQQSIAEAYEDLVKRGYTTKQALGAMRTELQGSVASGDDFADVVHVSSTTLESFGMRAKTTAQMTRNTKRAVNELAYAADMTSTGFKDLGYGMSYVGSSAHQAGFSLSETASAMGILSNNGLEASKAGTGLNQVINRLSNAAEGLKKGAKNNVLKQLGISPKEIMNSKGQLRSLATVFGVLNKHMKGMSKIQKINIMKSLFGTTGEQAGLILAKYNKQLDSLSKKTLKAGKDGKYVADLSAKNSQTAKMQMARLKQAGDAFTMTLGAKMLPAINEAGDSLVVFLTKSKDGKRLTNDFAKAVEGLATGLANTIKWIAHHRTETKLIAAGLGTAYGIVKLAQFTQWLNKTRLAMKGLSVGTHIINGFKHLGSAVKITGSLIKATGKGIAFAGKTMGKAFLSQLKLIARGVKGLGKGIYSAVKAIGGQALRAGKFLGSKIVQGLKATTKFSMGKRLATGAIAGGVVAAPEIVNAVKNRHSATKRSQNIGGAVGAIAGGTLTSMIPVVGPMLAPIGAIIGKYAGRWGGQAVNKFTKGWQRKKPPKKFWSLENLGWSAHNMWNGFTKSVGKTIKWFKKNWKEVGLYFVSPLAGAINSLYKHDKKFRKWVNGLAKGFKNAWKGTVKWFSNLGKNIQKAWHGMTKWFTKLGKNMAKGLKSSWKSITKWFSNIGKGIQKAWRGMVSWFTKLGRNMSKGLTSAWHGVVKFFTSIVRVVKHTWNTTVNFFRTLGRNTVNLFKAPWKTLVSWFKGIIDGIKEIWDAFWDKVSGPIKFIAKLLGGKIKVGKLHLASGTDWHKKYGVPAIVNDAPGQHYREGLIDTDGSIGLFPDKRNLPFWLKPGQDIINGEDMARMFGRAVHYANGTKTLVTETLESTDKPNSSHLLQKFVNVVQAHYKLASDEARKRDARYADSILHRNKLDRRRNKKDRENEEAKVKTLVTKTEESTQNPKYSRLISKNLVTKLVGNTDKQTKLVSKGVDLYQKDRVSRLLAENRSKQDSIKIIEAQKELTKAVKDGHKKEASTLRKELSKLKKDRTKQNHIASTRIRDLQATPAQRKAAQKKVVSDRKKLKALGDKIAKALSSGHASQVKSLTARFNVISKDLSLQKRLSKKPNPHLGQTFVDEGLLVGANRRIGHSEWISNSLFDKLTSKKKKKKKTKKRKSKKRKTRKTRRRKRSTRRRTTEVRISGGHVTGVATLVRKEVAKLRKQLTRRRRRSTRSRSRRRSSSSLEITTSSRKRSSSRRRSSRRSSSSSIKVSVAGSKGLKSLASKLKAIKSKKVKVTVKSSGSKALKSLAKRVKAIKGGKHKVTVKTAGTKSLKSLRKAEKSIKSATHHVKVKTSGVKELKTLQNNITDVHKRVNSLTKALKKDTFGKAIAKQAEEAVKSLKGKGNFSKQFETMTKQFTKDLKNMSKFAQKQFKDMWSAIKKSSSDGQKFVLSKFNTFKSSYTHGWSNLQNGIKKAFNRFWNDMRSLAHSGLRRVFSVLNSAISKIDNVVSEFGGNKKAVGTVKFAKGTDANGRLLHDTLAVVNDAETGPRQEAIVTDKNDVLLPKGNNVPVFLRKGWGVLNGTQTKSLGLPHFAGGTGLKQLYKIAKHNWEHPKQTANNMFGAVKGLTGAINQLAQGMNKKGTNQGTKWWSQLWKMVEDKINDGDLGPASGLLKAVEELGRGKHYSEGKRMSKFFADCSSLVSRALYKFYHQKWAIQNGNAQVVSGLWAHAHRIPKSEAKPGDPIFWNPDIHVGVYAGHGRYYSAYGPNDGGPVGMASVADAVPGHTPIYAKFNGLNTEGNKSKDVKVKANNRLQKFIKPQVGKGFWKTIQKLQEKYGPKDDGGIAGKPSGTHEHWMKQAGIPRSWWHWMQLIIGGTPSVPGEDTTWSPHAKNPTSTAYGIGQMLNSNYHYYERHGKDWRSNPIAQLMGMKDYIKDRYGDAKAAWEQKAHSSSHWYANGGIANKPSIFGEAGPEMAIPLIPSKSTRAWELIGKAIGILSGQLGLNQQQAQIDSKKEKEEHNFRQAVLLLLQQLLAKNGNVDVKLTTPAGRALWEVVEPYSKQEQRAEQIRERRGLSGRFN